MVKCVLPRSLEIRCLIDRLFRGIGMGFMFMLSGVCLGLCRLLVILGVILGIRLFWSRVFLILTWKQIW